MRDQLKALLWLRLALLRNAWGRGRVISDVIAVLAAVSALVASALLAVLCFFLAFSLLRRESSLAMLGILDVFVCLFLLLWCVGLLTELQRSDIIDFRKMLYLPVSLRAVFLLNFVTSLCTPAAAFFFLPFTGFVVGATVRLGPRMVLGLPLAAGFFFMVGAWTYYMRGLLAVLLENKRRRQAVIAAATMTLILAGQLPNLINLRAGRGRDSTRIAVKAQPDRPQAPGRRTARGAGIEQTLYTANLVLPPGWFPFGLASLVDRDYRDAGLAFAGLCLLGTTGLVLGYRSTRRFYLGWQRPGRDRRSQVRTRADPGRQRLAREWRLPWCDDSTSAVAVTAFLGYQRHPQFRVVIVLSLVMGAIILASFGIPLNRSEVPVGRELAALMLIVLPCLNFAQFLFNQFGVDRHGFRSYVLSPVPREQILLGKNLALAPMVLGTLLVYLLVGAFVLRLGPLAWIVVLVEAVQLYLLMCVAGNLLSTLFPFPVRGDAMRRSVGAGAHLLSVLLSLLLSAVVVVPATGCLLLDHLARRFLGYHGLPLALPASLLLLGITVVLYRLSLKPLGLLLLRREPAIIQKLTATER